MNVVMTENGGFIELQGTGEDGEFTHDQLSAMVALAEAGIKQLLAIQQASLASQGAWPVMRGGEMKNYQKAFLHFVIENSILRFGEFP